MEKYTVDLDKVLDEFEFNEEQAVRHALQHFKREELPATKYQKPHFKPINIAEADFGPCIETTMTYPNYHHNHSQDISHSLSKTEPASLNCISPALSDLIKPPGVYNCNVVIPRCYSKEGISVVLQEEDRNGEDGEEGAQEEKETEKLTAGETSINSSHTVNEGKTLETVEEVTLNRAVAKEEEQEEEQERVKVESEEGESCNEQTHELKSAEVEPVVVVEKEKEKERERKMEEEREKENEREKEREREAEMEREQERKREVEMEREKERKRELEIEREKEKEREREREREAEREREKEKEREKEREREKEKEREKEREREKEEEREREKERERERERAKEEEEEKQRKETKLPDVVEENLKKTSEEPVNVEKVEEESKKEEKSEEVEVEVEQKPEYPSKSETEAPKVEEPPQAHSTERKEICEPIIEKTEVKPIQFESQLDITDEELTKYLEELEEEEEEEKRRKESESKPPRPDTLVLVKGGEEAPPGSPGLTPLPRNVDAKEEGGSKEDSRREGMENASGEVKENVETVDDLESVLGNSSPEQPLTTGERRLGKVSPFWMPDHLASSCMECDSKFTVIKRRHHCRACGRILCSKCCGMRASLEYLQNQEQRVCETCFRTLAKVMMYELQSESEGESSPRRRPNPNNPMEYCSTVPPPLQVSSANGQPPPSVMVPVGVLKREGSSKVKEAPKQVMFSDGIRPGGDLTELDGSGDARNVFRKPVRTSKRAGTPPGNGSLSPSVLLPPVDPVSQSFIVEKGIPPICITNKGETTYEENWPLSKIMERLKDPDAPPLHFAINRNLTAAVKIVKLECCMKETCWVIVSKGMGCVGQDELIVLLTVTGEEDDQIPKEIFLQFHYIYQEASRGNTVNELGCWCVKESSFLDSKQHGGFLFIRPTFQCLNRIETPPPPFLVGVLIHRSEIPWARVFPFRLMLRLGAEFRYYPCPLVSVRFREPVYYEIGHTIINLLADFRNLSYTIPSVRGLRIHMEANQTSILIPRNRYDQVVRALNNSNDPVLALAGNFSPEADAHLVCMQSKGNEVTYSTHAININDKPRKVTGASFVVLNGALKTTSGVAAKSSIVEDGLMVQVPSETMTTLRAKLRNMEDWSVRCGPIEGRNTEEVVKIIWSEDDKNFNVGVKSVIDNMALDGMPSIRVHSGKDYMGCSKFIRWTQVFIIKCEDGATSAKIGDPLEVNKLSESIARATCVALTKLLELLAASGLTVLAVRATIDQDNVGYEAGSNGEKLAPIYMNSLDNELIPVLHKAASVNDSVAILELIFHIMDQ